MEIIHEWSIKIGFIVFYGFDNDVLQSRKPPRAKDVRLEYDFRYRTNVTGHFSLSKSSTAEFLLSSCAHESINSSLGAIFECMRMRCTTASSVAIFGNSHKFPAIS